MIDSIDTQAIKDQIAEIIADRPTQIIVNRGGVNLLPQTVRLVKAGSPRESMSEAGKQVSAGVLVIGDTSLDVARGDRFALAGVTYLVLFVDKNSPVKVVAEAQVLG